MLSNSDFVERMLLFTANNIGVECARLIAEALKINTTMHFLDVWGELAIEL